MLSRRQVVEILDRHGLHPSRALGQNFVVDANTVRRIARLAAIGPGERVDPGGHCPELARHFTGTTQKWFTYTNGAHIDAIDPYTYNRWYDFLELFVAHQAPVVNVAVTRAAAPVGKGEAFHYPTQYLRQDEAAATVEGSEAEQMQAFRAAYRLLDARIKLFVSLPIDKLDSMSLKQQTAQIGKMSAEVPEEVK